MRNDPIRKPQDDSAGTEAHAGRLALTGLKTPGCACRILLWQTLQWLASRIFLLTPARLFVPRPEAFVLCSRSFSVSGCRSRRCRCPTRCLLQSGNALSASDGFPLCMQHRVGHRHWRLRQYAESRNRRVPACKNQIISCVSW